MSAMPADTYPLSGLPLRDLGPYRVDVPRDFMARDARVRQSGKPRLLYDGVAVANAASLNFDSDLGATGFRNRALDYFEISTRLIDLYGFHRFCPQEFGAMTMSLEAGYSVYRLIDGRANGEDAEILSSFSLEWERVPALVSPFFEETSKGEVGMGPWHFSTSAAARAPTFPTCISPR
jgi:hypothetical protein